MINHVINHAINHVINHAINHVIKLAKTRNRTVNINFTTTTLIEMVNFFVAKVIQ